MEYVPRFGFLAGEVFRDASLHSRARGNGCGVAGCEEYSQQSDADNDLLDWVHTDL